VQDPTSPAPAAGDPAARPALAVCSWSLRPDDPAALAEAVRAAGLSAVQLALDPVVDDQATWGEAIAVLRGAGLEIASGMMEPAGEDYATLESIRRTGGFRPDETWERNLQRAGVLAELAAGAGIDLVTTHAGWFPDDDGDPLWSTVIERVRAIADAFGDRGVRLALETGQESAPCLQRFLEDLERPSVGVNFDPANMLLYGTGDGTGDPIPALEMLAPRVAQLHVKDAVPAAEPGQWGRETPAGEGSVDWAAFLAVVERALPDRRLVIEREGGDRRLEDVRTARAMLGAHGIA